MILLKNWALWTDFFNNILISRMWYIIFVFNWDIQYSSKTDLNNNSKL